MVVTTLRIESFLGAGTEAGISRMCVFRCLVMYEFPIAGGRPGWSDGCETLKFCSSQRGRVTRLVSRMEGVRRDGCVREMWLCVSGGVVV